MTYESKEVLNMLKVFHCVESSAKDFLFLSAFAMKYKDKIVKIAQTTINAIEEYKKLPVELKKELENDKSNYVSDIIELEKACKKAIENYKM
jgi:hypothetical protein